VCTKLCSGMNYIQAVGPEFNINESTMHRYSLIYNGVRSQHTDPKVEM
jgi:hypothetical protein